MGRAGPARLGEPGPVLGHLAHPGGRRRRPARRRRPRHDRARLRHRLLLGLARAPRRAARRRRPVHGPARHGARHAGATRHRVPADRGGRRGGPAAGRELRLRALGVRREPVVRAGAVDRGGRAAAAPGRPARLPHQLAAGRALLRARRRGGDGAPRTAAVWAPPRRLARRGRPLDRVPPPPRRDDPRAPRGRLRDRGAARAVRPPPARRRASSGSRPSGRGRGRRRRSGWRGSASPPRSGAPSRRTRSRRRRAS